MRNKIFAVLLVVLMLAGGLVLMSCSKCEQDANGVCTGEGCESTKCATYHGSGVDFSTGLLPKCDC